MKAICDALVLLRHERKSEKKEIDSHNFLCTFKLTSTWAVGAKAAAPAARVAITASFILKLYIKTKNVDRENNKGEMNSKTFFCISMASFATTAVLDVSVY